MFGTLIYNLIAVFFAWLESSGNNKQGLKYSLFTVFLFLALRYNFGNDYTGYLNHFLFIKAHSTFNISLFEFNGYEFGWVYLNRLSGPLGFFGMTALLACITCYVLYRFIKKYVPPKYYWFSVFLYVFSPGQMLTLSSAMRQEVAVILFLLAIDYIINKKVIKYFSLITLATFFHSSAILLYPLILISFGKWKIRFYYILIFSIIYMVPFIFQAQLFGMMESVTLKYFNFYSSYTKEVEFGINVGLGFILIIMINIFLIYYMHDDASDTHNILYKIVIISFFILPLGFAGVELIGRLNVYFYPVLMAVYPIIFLRIKNVATRSIFLSVTVLFTIYQFFLFFQSAVWIKAFGTYQTILSAPEWF